MGLADGSITIFHRNNEGLWDLKNFYLVNVDKPAHSIRCLINVYDNVWCGCRNKIFILNPEEFKLLVNSTLSTKYSLDKYLKIVSY